MRRADRCSWQRTSANTLRQKGGARMQQGTIGLPASHTRVELWECAMWTDAEVISEAIDMCVDMASLDLRRAVPVPDVMYAALAR